MTEMVRDYIKSGAKEALSPIGPSTRALLEALGRMLNGVLNLYYWRQMRSEYVDKTSALHPTPFVQLPARFL